MATSTERFGFTKPAGSDPASVVPLNSNTDLIELYLGRTQDSIAPLYDDTETYSVGDLRTYESRLYKCNTDILTPETFAPEKWDLTTAVQEGGGGGSGASAIEKTQAEYDALTPAQKTNGSIYMVQGEGASEDAFDMTQGSAYNEGSMSFTAIETDIESFWNGGGSIGGDWRTIAIDVTDLTAIKFSIQTTTCYAHNNSNVEEQTNPRFVNTVYLFPSIPSGWAYDYESQATDFLKFAYTNTDYGEQEFDVSELTGQLYVIWASTGWNAVMSDLTLIGRASLNNRIFYMGTEYANTNGGSGGGGGSSEAEDINYDNTTSQLTATNVQEAIDEVVANANTASEDILTLQNVQGYDEYDKTQTYAVGDYAIYNNIAYECTTAVSTAEPFDSTKWTATSIEQIIDGVKSDVSQLNSSLTIKSDMKTLTTNGNGVIGITSEFNLDMSKTILLGVFLEGRYKYENYYTRSVSTGVTLYNIAIIEAASQNYVRVANTSVLVYIRYLELSQ